MSGTQLKQGKIRKICDNGKQRRKNVRGLSVRNKKFAPRDALKLRKGKLRRKSDARSGRSAKKSESQKKRRLLRLLLNERP